VARSVEPEPRPAQRPKSVAPAATLTAAVAPGIVRAVIDSKVRLEGAIAHALQSHREPSWTERKIIGRSLAALLRWWGWIEPLHLVQVEEQLTLGLLLDCPEIEPVCRVWNKKLGDSPERMMSVGDAPNWTGRADGLKRWTGGRPVNADPWILFPAWLRDQLPMPPGEESAKVRKLAFLFSLQTRWPLWLGVRGTAEKPIWNQLREEGKKPWVHRRLVTAAKFEPDTDLRAIRASHEGKIAIQDLSSQAVGVVCDPDSGDRWWDVVGGSGLHALHLGALMKNKGTVISTTENEKQKRGTTLQLRKSPFRNIAVKLWDGRRLPAKAGSFDGVLLDAPCSDIGHWRRHPELRWTVRKEDLPALAAQQRQLLDLAATAVRPGGVLVYTVATVTVAETTDVINGFLKTHPEFRLDPFPHPLEESTTSGMLQLWPHLHDSEARFIARLIRTNTAPPR
jgi:16S rRNA (cytosine967-C5)-methyltransferase